MGSALGKKAALTTFAFLFGHKGHLCTRPAVLRAVEAQPDSGRPFLFSGRAVSLVFPGPWDRGTVGPWDRDSKTPVL